MPKITPVGPRLTDAGQILSANAAVESRVEQVQGQAHLSVSTSQGRGSVPLLVSAAVPGKVHIEQLDFFGSPTAVLVASDNAFGLLQGGQYYSGNATRENLARFVPLPLDPGALTATLVGRTPKLVGATATLVGGSGGNYQILLRSGTSSQTLWVDPGSFRVVKSETTGPTAYALEFQDFQSAEEGFFPKQIVLTETSTGNRFELTYDSDVVLNPRLDPSLFVPQAPKGVPVVDLHS